MRILGRLLKAIGLLVLAIVMFTIIWWFWPAKTPAIDSTPEGRSISQIEYVKIGGVEQCILIRSHDTRNPILLFLHGGPGMPMMYLGYKFQRPLEKYFTVVQWDRRGAGKTFYHNKPTAESMSTRQLIDDAYALIDTLRTRFEQRQVILVGHSFGTHLGSIMANERPELFSHYISIGQVVDNKKARVLQERFIREQAGLKERVEVITALDSIKNVDFESWLFEFGGELKASRSFFPLIWTGVRAPEYKLSEAVAVAKGSSFSSAHMKHNVLSGSIYEEVMEYQVPVYFLVGRWDYTTPHQLITEYYKHLQAPQKELIFFENSAHFPFFEEPDQFCEVVIRLINK
ncbi:MAG: alpha/beta hydrolase [Cyclobacteriaceae bacterium]|nr:alpha/beta hydrolase [Cyclobacteriaceae bacterium]